MDRERGLDSFVGSDGRGLDVDTRGLRKFSGNRVQTFACSMSLSSHVQTGLSQQRHGSLHACRCGLGIAFWS